MWHPSAKINHLKARAQILQQIRTFFAKRQVMEVETPLLCQTSVTDPYIQSIAVSLKTEAEAKPYFLQTSPEYAMKRLLAAGSGSIYQICKAFRREESGRWHQPEFTMIEWYRLGFDHHQLMDEMDDLLQLILHTATAERQSYYQVFSHYLHIDAAQASIEELAACARDHGLDVAGHHDRDTWLTLLLSHCIEPHLGEEKPFFLYDFPASQAALARIQPVFPPVAARFEVYYRGIELANGFHELQDAAEQRRRFEANSRQRQALGLPFIPIDEHFLAALEHGLPDCAGVALGLDRLVMLALGCQRIQEVMAFDLERA